MKGDALGLLCLIMALTLLSVMLGVAGNMQDNIRSGKIFTEGGASYRCINQDYLMEK